MADMTSPPPKPMKVMTSDIPADCQGVKGVAHHSPAPINTVQAMPPISPSQVLFGLTVGATLWRPSVFPKRIAIRR